MASSRRRRRRISAAQSMPPTIEVAITFVANQQHHAAEEKTLYLMRLSETHGEINGGKFFDEEGEMNIVIKRSSAGDGRDQSDQSSWARARCATSRGEAR